MSKTYEDGIKEERDRILAVIKTDGRNELLDTLGAVSMCWHPRPSGAFDSESALRHGERLLTKLEILIKKVN